MWDRTACLIRCHRTGCTTRHGIASRVRRAAVSSIPIGLAPLESRSAALLFLDRTPPSAPQRLSRFQRVRDSLLCLSFATEAEKRFALEIEQLLLGQRRRGGRVTAGENPRQFSADQR